MSINAAPLIARTPAPGCPACEAQRLHSREERREFHPYAGHGYVKEIGWTHPALAKEAEAQA